MRLLLESQKLKRLILLAWKSVKHTIDRNLFDFCVQVMEQIEKQRIQIYQFPECDSDEDEEFKKQDRELKVLCPINDISFSYHQPDLNLFQKRGKMCIQLKKSRYSVCHFVPGKVQLAWKDALDCNVKLFNLRVLFNYFLGVNTMFWWKGNYFPCSSSGFHSIFCNRQQHYSWSERKASERATLPVGHCRRYFGCIHTHHWVTFSRWA